jgi:hypothetical protein
MNGSGRVEATRKPNRVELKALKLSTRISIRLDCSKIIHSPTAKKKEEIHLISR